MLVDVLTIVFSDKNTSYEDLAKYVEAHYTEILSNETTKTSLKWVHVVISNLKEVLMDIIIKPILTIYKII